MGRGVSPALVLVGLLVVVAVVYLLTRDNKEGMRGIAGSIEATATGAWSPAKPRPYFQGMPPSLAVENKYHELIQKECGPDGYDSYDCRQKVYYKTLKEGTYDKGDLICARYKSDEDKYYKCLDGIYSNYLYMDHWAGPDRGCLCPDGSTGALQQPDGSCFCGPHRVMEDRRPLDQRGLPVDRVFGRA